MKKILTILMWSVGVAYAHGQQFSALTEVTAKYNEAAHVNMHITATGYSAEQTVLYTEKIQAYKSDNLYYTKAGHVEMLTNQLNLIIVNHGIKQIMVAPYDKRALAAEKLNYANQVDSLLKKADKVTEKKIQENQYQYTIYANKQVAELIEITIDTEKKTLQKMVYHYKNNLFENLTRVEVVFTHTDFVKTSNTEVFDDRRFLFVNNKNELIPTPKYATYEIIVTNTEDTVKKH